jgi:hypothetical protein
MAYRYKWRKTIFTCVIRYIIIRRYADSLDTFLLPHRNRKQNPVQIIDLESEW